MLGNYAVIGIVGSRSRNSVDDYNLVVNKLIEIVRLNNIEYFMICSGGASTGADDFAKHIAEKSEVPLLLFLPNWENRGKAGGPLRNKKIAENSDYLIACWDKKSRGTSSCIGFFKGFHGEERLFIV